jgi:predicted RNA-binding protein with PUA-like domain
MNYWLLKSEPDEFGWPDLIAQGQAEWTGIRNFQARNNLRAMAVGDRAFFYHSNIGKEIVGIVEITQTAAPDSSTDDPRWDSVWVRPLRTIKPITLDVCKVVGGLSEMALVKSPRLSVQPVTQAEWDIICTLGAE